MTTLRIEHPITDYPLWKKAFDGFAEARANAERKITADYASCMRAKPKYECEQLRAKAISALDNPKPAKPQRPRKQASAAVETQAAR